MAHNNIGIILANTGSPSAPTPEAVKKYLADFLMDPHIVPMNKLCWWLVLHCFILPKRSYTSSEKYQKIWRGNGSPLITEQEALAQKLQQSFFDAGEEVYVQSAMSYGEPGYEQAFQNLRNAGCEQVIVLPIYPQPAYSTVGAVTAQLKRLDARGKLALPYTVVSDYHDNSTYIKAISHNIMAAGFNLAGDDRLLFSYHSIPMKDIEAGDTYEPETSSTSLAIAGELGIDRNRWTIGYNCRFDKEREWLSPFTADVLRRWGQAGAGRIFFVCPNFAIDCLETLYDVEYDLKPVYLNASREAGRPLSEDSFTYVPCLNSSDAHVRVLRDVLSHYVQ